MSRELPIMRDLKINPQEKRSGLFTRQPLSLFGKVAVCGFLIVTIQSIGFLVTLKILNSPLNRNSIILVSLLLAGIILVIARIRWLQALGVLVGMGILYLFFTQPYIIESLANPKGLNNGYADFIGLVILIGIVLTAFVATIATVLQNYRLSGRQNPRWFASVSMAIVGIVIGALCIGTLAPIPAAPVAIAPLQAPQIPTGPGVPTSVNMGMPNAPISVPQLQVPATTTAPVDRFTLTAQPAQINLGSGTIMPAWTFNGIAPGPILHVRQGDEVVVTLINHLSFGVTIHWHGVRVPNAADGVAGVTQDAVKTGQSYVYRFIALDAGTYWYHSHQFSSVESINGLYGMLIVDPAQPTIHADVDYSVALHVWNGLNDQPIYTMNSSAGTLNLAAHPGQWVRLRIANTAENSSSNPALVTLLGAPFQVVSLDGHDLHGPQWLTNTPLPIGTAQRYDIYFQMPVHGSVALVTTNDGQEYAHAPALVIGQGSLTAKLPAVARWFNLATYGTPAPDPVTPQTHFDATYSLVLGNQLGTSLGRMGMTYTVNGKVFPDTAMIMVKEGQIIKLHFDNQTALYHPMHLHGHILTVLAVNGKPLTGSPVHVDTILVLPHTTVDVAFVANNPGIWMLHCHNFVHANWGMDLMVTYNVSTPYTVGTVSGNFPD